MPPRKIPLDETFTILEQLRNTSLSHEKIEILQQNPSEEFDGVLRLVYAHGPYGFTARSLGAVDSASQPHTVDQWWPAVLLFFGRLQDKDIRGLAAKQHAWSLIRNAPSKKHAVLFKDLLDRNLRIGMNIPSLNLAKPGFIPVFRCQESKLFDPRHVVFPVYVQKKITGIRALSVRGKLFSKTGTALNLAAIEKHIPENVVLDGTLGFDPQDREQITRFFVFDILPRSEWDTQEFNVTLEERITRPFERNDADCPEFVPNDYVRWVRMTQCSDFEAMWTMYSACLEEGYPGVMIKNPSSPYTLGRTRDWMRLVPLETMTVEVTDVIEGKGLFAKSVNGLKCRTAEGRVFTVSTGMDEEQRKEWWEHGIPSKQLVVRYQELGEGGIPKFARLDTWV